MPRLVDHGARRLEIIRALVSFAVREGLHNVSLRSVAAEAGVSLRLVQYYFETKSGLMQAGLAYLEDRSNAAWAQRREKKQQPGDARAALVSLFEEALPTDRPGREFHLLWTSYAMLAMTDPEISNNAFVDGPERLLKRLVAIFEQAKVEGVFHKDTDVEREASILLGLIHGFGTAVLVGQQTGEAAMDNLLFHVDRLGRGRDA